MLRSFASGGSQSTSKSPAYGCAGPCSSTSHHQRFSGPAIAMWLGTMSSTWPSPCVAERGHQPVVARRPAELVARPGRGRRRRSRGCSRARPAGRRQVDVADAEVGQVAATRGGVVEAEPGVELEPVGGERRGHGGAVPVNRRRGAGAGPGSSGRPARPRPTRVLVAARRAGRSWCRGRRCQRSPHGPLSRPLRRLGRALNSTRNVSSTMRSPRGPGDGDGLAVEEHADAGLASPRPSRPRSSRCPRARTRRCRRVAAAIGRPWNQRRRRNTGWSRRKRDERGGELEERRRRSSVPVEPGDLVVLAVGVVVAVLGAADLVAAAAASARPGTGTAWPGGCAAGGPAGRGPRGRRSGPRRRSSTTGCGSRRRGCPRRWPRCASRCRRRGRAA